MPKVSICIPCFNNPEDVDRLLWSIFEQEYTDYEVNISDDSTDERITELVDKYRILFVNKPINYVHNETPYGHIYNWNAAIKMASGEYIKIMFSDDWFTDKDSLGELVGLLDKNEDAVLAFSGSRQVMLDIDDTESVKHVTDEHNTQSYDRCASQEFIDGLKKDYRNLFLGNQIGAPSATLYRRGNELTLFDEESNWASDMFLYFDLLQKKSVFAYTEKPLISIGVHAHQYTESFSDRDIRIYDDYRYMYTKYNLWESKACRKYFLDKFIIKYHKGLKEAKSLGISSFMYYMRWLREQKETVRCFIKSRMKKGSTDKK